MIGKGKRRSKTAWLLGIVLPLASAQLAAACSDEDYYWCNYYYGQCLSSGSDPGQCESQYLMCLVSIGCTPP